MHDAREFARRRVFCVVLAAGTATRFGSSKQLAVLGDETLVGRACRIADAAAGGRSLLIAGHDAGAVVRAAQPWCRFVAVNDRYETGMASSVRLAERILAHAADALLFTLADQPAVSAAHLRSLVATWSGEADGIVVTDYGDGRQGAPALLGAGTFPELRGLRGDEGARSLFANPRYCLLSVPFARASIDIDTVEDLRDLRASGQAAE